MEWTFEQLAQLPTSYYRVSAKAIVFDDQKRLLVSRDDKGEWEIPGGGWEFGEPLDECIRRELTEELQAKVVAVNDILFVYVQRTERNIQKLSIAVAAQIAPGPLKPTDDNLVEARYVTKDEFVKLPFQSGENAVVEYADKVWSE